ncbi:MAG: hypothetical protein GC180_00400 [Bacteroidetes bacterium]|nr:hypothetical protein [Bacteroidota bacterium]
MNPKVNFFFNKETKWQKAYEHLRLILLDTEMKEELKWGCPCYTIDGKNVVLIHGFNDYCALLFHKGTLMNDPGNLLIQQTKNVQAARQMRFFRIDEVFEKESIIRSYVQNAIEVEKSGEKVELMKTDEFPMPDELLRKFEQIPNLQNAFEALTPGRQRAYRLYFSSAKQTKTREARVEKFLPAILDGKGMDDV